MLFLKYLLHFFYEKNIRDFFNVTEVVCILIKQQSADDDVLVQSGIESDSNAKINNLTKTSIGRFA